MIQATIHYQDESTPMNPMALSDSSNNRSKLAGMLILLASMMALAGCSIHPRTSSRAAECFAPVDRITLVQNAADYEALFTLAGGLKPMSSGFWRCSFEVDDPDLTELEKASEMLEVLQNDVWYADIQIFAKVHDGERNAHAFVVHRQSLAAMIDRHEPFWSSWDITPETHPTKLIEIVDRMPRADRWRGYGYLYGYPDEAVDFFVEAGISAYDDDREMGPGKDRQFTQIPTYAAESGRFTYAVPLDHEPTEADRHLSEQARLILDAYIERRPHMIDLDAAIRELLELNSRFEPSPMTDALIQR